MIQLKLTGATELTRDDGVSVQSVLAQPKRLALLVYLALHQQPGEFVRREHLMAVFWPEKDEAHARNALRQALHFLRRSLGGEAFESRGDGEVTLVPERFRVDVWELVAAKDPHRILQLWRGPLLEGFVLDDAPAFNEWLDGERARLRRRAWERAAEGADRLATSGNAKIALELARFAVELRPLDEESSCRLMRLLAEGGHRAAALREFDRLEAALMETIGRGADEVTRTLARTLQSSGRPGTGGQEEGRPETGAHDPGEAVDPHHAPDPGAATRSLPPPGETAFAVPTGLETGTAGPGRVPWLRALGYGLLLAGILVGASSILDRPSPLAPATWLLVEDSPDSTSRPIQDALLEVLRVDLNDAPGIDILPRDHVADGLRRMRRPVDRPLDRAGALELVRRDGLSGVVRTAISRTGAAYVLTAEILDRDGEARQQVRTTTRGSSDLIPAFNRMSRDLRALLPSIRTTPRPALPSVTTSSMEALEHYVLAQQTDEGAPPAREHLERAVELDPDFAMAWRDLGLQPQDPVAVEVGVSAPLLRRALDLRHGVSRAERHLIEFTWHDRFTGDHAAAAAASAAYLRARPADEGRWLGQQLLLAGRSGDLDAALALLLRKREIDGGLGDDDWLFLVGLQTHLRDDSGLARTLADPPSEETALIAEARIAGTRQEWDRARRALEAASRVREADWLSREYWSSTLALGEGRVGAARRAMARVRELMEERGTSDLLVATQARLALAELFLRSDTLAARSLVDVARTMAGDRADVGSLVLAWSLAEIGDIEAARMLLGRWAEVYQDFPRARWPRAWWVARAAVQLADGRPAEAVATLHVPIHEPVGRLQGCRFCPDWMMARALDRAGRTGEAVEYYERTVSTRSIVGTPMDRRMTTIFVVSARERLAQLYEGMGRLEDAAHQYREILRQWRNADPGDARIQRRIQQTRRSLDRVGG